MLKPQTRPTSYSYPDRNVTSVTKPIPPVAGPVYDIPCSGPCVRHPA